MRTKQIEKNDDGNVICPVCGDIIISEDGETTDPCKHVKFIFLDSVGEFSVMRLPGEGIADKIKEALWEGDWDDVVKAKLIPKGVSVLELTESGLACGPVSFVTLIGIAKQ